MLRMFTSAAAVAALCLALGDQVPARADAEDQVQALRGEIAALNKKIDDLTRAIAQANDRVDGLGKKLDGLFYGSCPNRRLCGFQ